MAEILFADGERTVDDIYKPLILEATDGGPERFTFKEAMKLLGRVLEKRVIRDTQARVIGDHLRRWGR